MTPSPHDQADLVALLRAAAQPCVATIGTFDGVHEGHRRLVGRAREHADQRGLSTTAITFSPRPDQVLAPAAALPDICPIVERVRRLREAGAERVVVIPFSREVAAISSGEFVGLLSEELKMRALCVGEDFALGRGRSGTPAELRAAGLDVLTISLLPSATEREDKASSTRVRRLIASGVPADLALSNA